MNHSVLELTAVFDCKFEVIGVIIIITSGQSNLTKGRIAAAHGRFYRIRQVAPICTPIGIRTVQFCKLQSHFE